MEHPDRAGDRFRQVLGGGDFRSIGRSEEVAAQVLEQPALFGALFECVCDRDALIRMRAADAVEKVTRERPDYLLPHKARLLGEVAASRQQEVRWHAALMFNRLPLDRDERRRLREILVGYLDDRSSIVRTCAMEALAELAERDPEHRPSIVRLLERLTVEGSPAMRSRGRRLLRQLHGGGAAG